MQKYLLFHDSAWVHTLKLLVIHNDNINSLAWKFWKTPNSYILQYKKKLNNKGYSQ